MPAWVDTPEKEEAWADAKGIVAKQRKKGESSFDDKDWGLVTTIAKNKLKSSAQRYQTAALLAHVEHLLDQRRRRERWHDHELPAEARNLIAALSTLMAVCGQTITDLRAGKPASLPPDEAHVLTAAVQTTAAALSKVRR